MKRAEPWDAVIVGAGPAGLSAALILGRCRRRAVICDSGEYRNQSAYAMFGFLSRDGIDPHEFLKECRRQLQRYDDLQWRDRKVTRFRRREEMFVATLDNGEEITAKSVILATGIRDEMPPLAGIERFFGKSVFLCPYCDGWEFKDRPIAAYGRDERGPCFALLMRKWTSKVILCTDGPMRGSAQERRRLRELHIPVIEDSIARLEGRNGQLSQIVFNGGNRLKVRTLFFNTPVQANDELAHQLGCLDQDGRIKTRPDGTSGVARVYLAGDVSPDIKLAVVAAAEGAKAAYALNKDLLKEEGLVFLK